MTLSIIIPALNEEKTVTVCIRKALRAIERLGMEGEVLVVDNGSTDNTVKVAEEAGARVINVSEKGYGSALMSGFEASKGKFLIMADADDSYNFEEIEPFVNKLEEGYDLVMGNRFKGEIQNGAMPFLHRYLGTPVLTWIMNLFFKTGIGDTNCGMRGLTRKAFHRMHLKASGMEFATEMTIKASLVKLKIAEVPCNLYKDKREHKPHLNTWSDGWRHLRFMLLFKTTWTFFIPGFMLFFIGLIGMIFFFLRDAFAPGRVAFLSQKHMLSSMLLFLGGVQIVSLGLAAKAFSFSMRFDYASKTTGFLRKYFSLERGIVCGGVFVISSVVTFIYLFFSYYWAFLPRLTELLRFDLAVSAIAFSILGIQLIYTSFLLSLFYIKVK